MVVRVKAAYFHHDLSRSGRGFYLGGLSPGLIDAVDDNQKAGIVSRVNRAKESHIPTSSSLCFFLNGMA